ncbi:hypothetical protein HDU96_005093 [Phlyctochytrium bullatum]|nr:hypothetical protein HDU96_005093 [Phlyctochytrium bullatum]
MSAKNPPSYAAAAAAPRNTLQPPNPSNSSAARRKSAPESSLKIPLIDRSENDDQVKQELIVEQVGAVLPNPGTTLTPPAIAVVAASDENSWKAVGSPPRRLSSSVPQTPAHEANTDPQAESEDAEELILMRKRGIRTRAASTPNPLVNVTGHSLAPTEEDLKEDAAGENATEHSGSQTGSGQKWGGLGWGPSIWKDGGPGTSFVPKAPTFLGPESLSQSQQGRQYRSFSFSLGEGGQGQEQSDNTTSGGITRLAQQQPLRAEDDEDYADYTLPKARSRSKSSSAIYGLIGGDQEHYLLGAEPPQGRRESATYSEINPSIWSQSHAERQGHEPSLLHRRASTQPNYGPVWESLRGDGPLRDSESGGDSNRLTPGGPSPERVERYRQQRRFSHAPNLYNDFSQQVVQRFVLLIFRPHLTLSCRRQGADPDFQFDSRRRHSLAGPPLLGSGRFLENQMDNLYLDDPNDPHLFEEIDDYFENTEHRTRAWVEAGKNLQMQSYPHPWPLYVVEFKAGRIDFFYVTENQTVKNGDLVIVEADRGKDLGKVINDSISNAAQLQMFQNQHGDAMLDSHFLNKEIHPKRIFRLAQANEIPMLVSKSQDEAKAMAGKRYKAAFPFLDTPNTVSCFVVCQSKIRQKKLPMEVVDAEYQWYIIVATWNNIVRDRRKLTFYFVADRRIDFRELVRGDYQNRKFLLFRFI